MSQSLCAHDCRDVAAKSQSFEVLIAVTHVDEHVDEHVDDNVVAMLMTIPMTMLMAAHAFTTTIQNMLAISMLNAAGWRSGVWPDCRTATVEHGHAGGVHDRTLLLSLFLFLS